MQDYYYQTTCNNNNNVINHQLWEKVEPSWPALWPPTASEAELLWPAPMLSWLPPEEDITGGRWVVRWTSLLTRASRALRESGSLALLDGVVCMSASCFCLVISYQMGGLSAPAPGRSWKQCSCCASGPSRRSPGWTTARRASSSSVPSRLHSGIRKGTAQMETGARKSEPENLSGYLAV